MTDYMFFLCLSCVPCLSIHCRVASGDHSGILQIAGQLLREEEEKKTISDLMDIPNLGQRAEKWETFEDKNQLPPLSRSYCHFWTLQICVCAQI